MAVLKINEENFDEKVKNSKLPVLIDFWAAWCGPCKMMSPVFEELSEEFEGVLEFAKVNTDENSDLSNEFSISGIPCLVLTKEGKEVDRIIGFMPKDALKAKIDALVSKL